MGSVETAWPKGVWTMIAASHPDVAAATAAGSMALANQLARTARIHPDRVALQLAETRRTYAELDRRVNRLARALRERGVHAGDRVAVLATNHIETVEAFYAVLRLGAIVVPVNFRLVAGEVAYIVHDCAATLMIVDPATAPLAEAALSEVDCVRSTLCIGDDFEAALAAEPDDELNIVVPEQDPAFIMYTSGTTGRPKGAVLTHRNLVMAGMLQRIAAGGRCPDGEVVLLGVPMFHIAGMGTALGRLLGGDRVVIYSGAAFDPADVVDLLEREQITTTFFVPSQWQAICAVPGVRQRNLALSNITWGASPATPSTLQALADTFPNAAAFTAFGQTETCATVCLLRAEDAVRKRGSIGTPIPGIEVRIVDDELRDVKPGEIGEIVYRGPVITPGYWGKPEATAEAFAGGWFHSGDLCKADEDGFIWVVDRKKDMIISGGENIYCAEVEAVIDSHPKVAEVAVIGVKHEKWVQTPVAVVTAVDPADPPTLADVVEHCRDQLASYKKPTALIVVDSLPRTATGKVQKFELRKLYAG
jgi:acyl-CoA synthetase (AMP-forming)/AMP-acid ligase II